MHRIPDSLTYSSEGIAAYINSNFTGQRQKSWAIFSWIAGNIHYEFDSIFSNNYYQTPAEVSEKILKARTGVCLQYACLFTEISNKACIKSYVIQGYTKQHGVVDWLPHAWCAGYIDTAWYLFDPTWGSGYAANKEFIEHINNYYFMIRPEDLIISHMPFDPLWQFLHYPLTNQEFYDRNFRVNKNKSYFNFLDTLDKYEHESDLERYISSARRIEQNGILNAFISTNYFVQMLDSTEYYLTASVIMLEGIKDPEESMAASMVLLKKSLDSTGKVLNAQKDMLYWYLKTRRQWR